MGQTGKMGLVMRMWVGVSRCMGCEVISKEKKSFRHVSGQK